MAHPIGGIWFWFIAFYLFGIDMAYKEKKFAKYSLPLIIKYILFLGSFNKFTLNIIIYQFLLLASTTIALIACYFVHSIDKQEVYSAYRLFMTCVWIIIEFICVIKVAIYEKRK